MGVLSIQSHVVMGYVGNSAAVFALQRMGHEVWPVHTLLFSNHPGHGDFGGQNLQSELLFELVAGLHRQGVFESCEALLSGYLGFASTGPVVLEALSLARQANRSVKFVLDPVIGDEETGVFVADDVVAFIRDELLTQADIVTPNEFELKLLTGEPAEEQLSPLVAADRLRAKGPGLVLVTGIENDADVISNLLVSDDGAWQVDTPKLDLGRRANGAGDFFSACFLGHLLSCGDLVVSLEQAVASVYAVLSYTAGIGLDELDLVRSQSQWMAPRQTFPARQIRS